MLQQVAAVARGAAEGAGGESGTVMIIEQPLMFWIMNLLVRPTALCLWLPMTAVRLCIGFLEFCVLSLRKTCVWGASSSWGLSRKLGTTALLAAASQVLAGIRCLWAPLGTATALVLCVAAWQRGTVLRRRRAQPPPERNAAYGGAGAPRQHSASARRRTTAGAASNTSIAGKTSKLPLVAGCKFNVKRPALPVQQDATPSTQRNSLQLHPSAASSFAPNAAALAPKAPAMPLQPQEVLQRPSPALRQHLNDGQKPLTVHAHAPSPQPSLTAGTAAACCKADELAQRRELHKPQQLPLSQSPLQPELQMQAPVTPAQPQGAVGLRHSEHGAQPQEAHNRPRAPAAAVPPAQMPARRGASALQGAPWRHMAGPEPEGTGGEVQCVVCWERPVGVQLAPCGHMCLCG